MTQAQYTPKSWPTGWQSGPVYRHPKTGCWHCSIMSNGIIIMKVEGRTKDECETIANQAASGPELLEALREAENLIAFIRHRDAFWHTSENLQISANNRAAIAKARGQS